MPIRINLLAESQIAEDLRRRDPVKRAIYAGAFLTALALAWSSYLQLAVMLQRSHLVQEQSQIESRTNQFQNILSSLKQLNDTRAKLGSLQQLSDARFLQGTLLNALQQLSIDGVQLTRIKVDQSYQELAAVKAETNNDIVTRARPAMMTEKISVALDARDTSANPGDQVNKFKDAVASQPYLKSILSSTNGVLLTTLSPPQIGPDGRPFVMFTLQCNLPPIQR